MASRLNWEKAAREDRFRRSQTHQARATQRQARLADFVSDHGIGCFSCGTRQAEWAKTGMGKEGAWAICVPCVNKRRSSPA